MSGFSNPIIGGGGALAYPAIHSPNFAPGTTGWTIRKDGSAEFNNLVVRNGQIISGTALYYSGTPAKGTLVASIAAADGTDAFGTNYYAGIATYTPSGGNSLASSLLSTIKSAYFQYNAPAAGVQGSLIGAFAATGGTDPVTGASYIAAQQVIDPVFGTFLRVTGAIIDFGIAAALSQLGRVTVQQGAGATRPYIALFAPEQGQSGHLVMLMQGTSPDGTKPGQFIIASEPTGYAVPSPTTTALFEIQGTGAFMLTSTTAVAFFISLIGDAANRFRILGNGRLQWGDGTNPQDAELSRLGANLLQVVTADLDIATAGRGLRVKEGANAKQGTATLAAGTVTVANTSVTASSRIILTAQDNNSTGALRVSARTAGTSFVITSSNAADSGVVAYQIFEPG